MFDVIVVGGGPAGLSAALMLGRCRRRVLVCDRGEPRNRHSLAVHGYFTRDGTPPLELNAIGRKQLEPYDIDYRAVTVNAARRANDRFLVSLADGTKETARFLLIATGVADELPPIAGMEDCYGRSVFHCPFCDAWEWRDRRLAVLGNGKSAAMLSLSLKSWSPSILLCLNGSRLDRETRERLRRNQIDVRTERVARLEHHQGNLASIVFHDGRAVPADALFFQGEKHAQSDLAERIGCAFNRKGVVTTGKLSNTNVPGVFVAGDASRDAQFVVVAAAEGVKAAVAINQALQRAELAP
jgi:thioredoxin reductase